MKKVIFVIVIMMLLSIPKIIHKNSKHISAEKVNFEDKVLIKKTEDGVCHLSATDDDIIKVFTPFSSIEKCLSSGGILEKK